jgi:hypothetical protein
VPVGADADGTPDPKHPGSGARRAKPRLTRVK